MRKIKYSEIPGRQTLPSETLTLDPEQKIFQSHLVRELAEWFSLSESEIFLTIPVNKYPLPMLMYYQLMYVCQCGGRGNISNALVEHSFPHENWRIKTRLNTILSEHTIQMITSVEYRKDFLVIAIKMNPLVKFVKRPFATKYSKDNLDWLLNRSDWQTRQMLSIWRSM